MNQYTSGRDFNDEKQHMSSVFRINVQLDHRRDRSYWSLLSIHCFLPLLPHTQMETRRMRACKLATADHLFDHLVALRVPFQNASGKALNVEVLVDVRVTDGVGAGADGAVSKVV